MLKLSRLTDYAVVVLSRMGQSDAPLLSAPGLATRTGLAEPTVAKVLKILAQSGIVEGLRGARGGYRLTRSLNEIKLSQVIVAFDGPIALTACVEGGGGGCESEHCCPVRGRWDPVNRAIQEALAHISVADLAGGGCLGGFLPLPTNNHLAAE